MYCLKELNGNFLLFAWNLNTEKWHVITGRFGTLHAYYNTNQPMLSISTCFASAAAGQNKSKLDWLGISGFFALGFFPSNRTWFEGVSIFEPAAHYVFGQKGVLESKQRYWQWSYTPERRRSCEDTLAVFSEVFSSVLSEQTREGNIALPISGGLDSRSTVAALTSHEQGASNPENIWAYSYGYTYDSIETEIAGKIAERRKLRFNNFTIDPYLFYKLDLILASLEGYQDLTQSRQACILEPLKKNSDYVIAAHWGDVWLDDVGLTDESSKALNSDQIFQHAFQKFEKEGDQWLLDNICQGRGQIENPLLAIKEELKGEFDKYSHIKEPDFRVKAFKTDQWSFRWTLASLRMFQAAVFPRLPFYDTRLSDFFATVPSLYLRDRGLQIEYLKRYSPDLAKIAWQARGANLYWYRHADSLLLPKRIVNKICRMLSGRRIIERNWEIQFMREAGKEKLAITLLKNENPLHDFASPNVIKELLDNFYRDPYTQKRGYTVCMLLTFSAWLRKIQQLGLI